MEIIIYTVRAGGVAQAVQHLPSKCKARSSNPSTAKIISTVQNCYEYLINK
jgi:hypothetical protein